MKIPRTEILLVGVFSLITFSLGNDGEKRELMSKKEVTEKYDKNGDGELDYREKMAFLRSLDEEERNAYRRHFNESKTSDIRDEHGERDNDKRGEGIRTRLDEAGERLRELVESGEITEEQARRRMEEMRRRAAESLNRDHEGHEQVQADHQIRDLLEKMRNEDKLTDKQVDELYGLIFSKKDDSTKRDREMSFGRYLGNLIHGTRLFAVGDKNLKKLHDLGNAQINRQSNQGGRVQTTSSDNLRKRNRRGITVEEYRRGERQIREAERKGEVSKKDADKRLAEMHKAITSENREAKKKGHDERGVKYRAAEEKIWAAVKDGKLSEEDAQKRLGAIKKQIWADKGKEQNRGGKDPRAEKFRAAEEKIWATVKASKLSKKDAGEKLAALKKEMFGGKDHDKKDPDIEKLKRQLQALKRENERLRKRLERGRKR